MAQHKKCRSLCGFCRNLLAAGRKRRDLGSKTREVVAAVREAFLREDRPPLWATMKRAWRKSRPSWQVYGVKYYIILLQLLKN